MWITDDDGVIRLRSKDLILKANADSRLAVIGGWERAGACYCEYIWKPGFEKKAQEISGNLEPIIVQSVVGIPTVSTGEVKRGRPRREKKDEKI